MSKATQEHWAKQPVPHTLSVAVHPEFQRQALGTAVSEAWRDARPSHERYSTAVIGSDNVASLTLFDRLGAQIVGMTTNGKLFVLMPLRGQSAAEVGLQVASIQHGTPDMGTALRGLCPIAELPRPEPHAVPGHDVALPMSSAIQHAADLRQGNENGK